MMFEKLLGILFVLFITNTFAIVNNTEKNALKAFYDASSNRDDWATNWDFNNTDPCDNNWIGITCNDEQTSITQITLDSKGIIGSIPAELGNLSNLQYLILF